MVDPMRKSLLSKAVTAACAMVLCLGVSACGGNSDAKNTKSDSKSSSSSEKIEMHQIAGVTAKGELGKKPTISFKTPMTVENNSYVVLQKGDGAQIEDGDRVCSQGIAISVKDGSQLASTWEKNTPDCSTVVTSDTSQMREDYYKIFKSLKLNSTVAFGVNDSNSTSSSSTGPSYLMVLTLVSKSKNLKKATGDKVANVPADLPKVTLAKNGKPSIDMNGYKGSDSLVSQDLIKGKGAVVKDTQTVVANYTGWLLDGTQFDSSYDRGQTLDFICGAGMMIRGFDQAVADMEVGQTVDIHLMPEEAYGMPDPENIITIEISQLPGSEDLNVGERVFLRNMMGQPFPVTVTAKDEKMITLDANHEMAGKELNFRIELVEVQ